MEKRLVLQAKDFAPTREDLSVLGAFNPAVAEINGETILLARVAEVAKEEAEDHYPIPYHLPGEGIHFHRIPKNHEAFDYSDIRMIRNEETAYLTSFSHFRIARVARDGDFTIDETVISPQTVYEEYGIEDPRITKIDNTHYITYSAVSRHGIGVALMKTDDFRTFKREGIIFHPDNKNCVLFPEKINGRYYAMHRPTTPHFGALNIWVAESPDLKTWGNHRVIKGAVPGYTESDRIGAGAPPFLTEDGWVVIYHSADKNANYHLCAMLLDKEDPTRILMKSKEPLLSPEESYEKEGFLNNVVFTCGLTNDDDKVTVYYGVCDKHIASCTFTMEEIWNNMEAV